MTKGLLIVFTKNPVAGRVKTRLAKSIGKSEALKVYQILLEHTLEISIDENFDTWVSYSDYIEEQDLWSDKGIIKHLQQGNDLGERMHNAFKKGFNAGYNQIVLIGSDCYELQTQHLDLAFQALQKNKIVIGPARDGGYYLIGQNELNPMLFKDINWGTSKVLSQTLHQINNEDVFLLQELNDIDTYDDLKGQDELLKLLNIHD